MTFRSILFDDRDAPPPSATATDPDFFHDLNLDQIVEVITAERQEYDLVPFFRARLAGVDAIAYRHEVMRDLERDVVMQSVQSFAAQMRRMRLHLTAVKTHAEHHQRERWFLDAVEIYCRALISLGRDLEAAGPESRGLRAFHAALVRYVESARFVSLERETTRIASDLAAIRYGLLIDDNRVTVRLYESEADYSAVVQETFAKFEQGATKDYRMKFPADSSMSEVESRILDLVAKLNPDVFSALDAFYGKNSSYLDPMISRFDREIQFYVAYLEYMALFERAGLTFCYPQVLATSKEIDSRGGFDLALARQLVHDGSPVVCNDFSLAGSERILVVTGPNQGGKTTFARAFGCMHYLASLGCPVPGTEARLFLFDELFTHFEREEDIGTLQGKLQDDLVRMRRILDRATPNSLIIMNEIFSSTTVQDAAYLAREIVERISRLDALCVCVTFLDELSSLNDKTVSMVATVVPNDPATRTYRLVRRPADGVSYALAVAERYGLTYAQMHERAAS